MRFLRNWVWWELGSNKERPQNLRPIRGCLGDDRASKKNAKGRKVTVDFPNEMGVNVVS